MNTVSQTQAVPPIIRRRFKKRYVLAVIGFLGLVFSVRAVAGYFLLGSESAALRKSVLVHAGGQVEKKFAFRLGWFTTGLVRVGSRFFHLPPEPRSVIETLHRVEVGVYRLPNATESDCAGEILARTDATMKKRGWERVVGVVQNRQIVAVYAPHRGLSKSNLECAVMVLHERDLVIAAGSGNPLPLIELASRKMENRFPRL